MAVVTNLRVEATSQSTTTLRWTAAGSGSASIYRSTDGVTYAFVIAVTDTLGIYEDTGLSAGTKYWYKISNDAGVTFSSVVTVFTHSCGVPNAQQSDLALPRVGDEVTADSFNTLADAVETSLTKFVSPQGQTCVACITDGALVIDCVTYADCQSIEVAVDQDINSISLPNCENTIVDIGFIIPPNVTRKIGGWPKGIGFTGDEGYTAPIVGGASGRFVNEFINRGQNINGKSGRSKPGTTTQGTAQGGSSVGAPTCTCIPGTNGELTIKTCTPAGANQATPSLNCGAATTGLKLFVCGGRGPYTWSNTGGVTLSKTSGTTITVSPPVNTGSGVAGNAYNMADGGGTDTPGGACITPAGTTHTCTVSSGNCRTYGCNDQLLSTIAGYQPACCPPSGGSAGGCAGFVTTPCTNPGGSLGPCCAEATCNGVTRQVQGTGTFTFPPVDVRSAPMIASGCQPCVLQSGSTVTVTDSLGTQTTIVLRS